MSIKTHEIHNSYLQDAPDSTGITRMVSEADYISQLQQTDALQTSLNNIIYAFGISGEGAHSKLVIEYVHGLVAENAALKAAVPALKEVSYENDSFDDVSIAEQIGFNEAVRMTTNNMQSTPVTDAAIAEIKAQGVDESRFLTDVITAAGLLSHGKQDKGLARRITDFCVAKIGSSNPANLRAGRKG